MLSSVSLVCSSQRYQYLTNLGFFDRNESERLIRLCRNLVSPFICFAILLETKKLGFRAGFDCTRTRTDTCPRRKVRSISVSSQHSLNQLCQILYLGSQGTNVDLYLFNYFLLGKDECFRFVVSVTFVSTHHGISF